MLESTKRIDTCAALVAEQARQAAQEQLYSLLRQRKEEEQRRPPPFDVTSIKKDNFIRKNSQFLYFIEALQAWNNSISRLETKFDRPRYEALKFIYFHLKNISLQDQRIKNLNVHRLFVWFQEYSTNFSLPLAMRLRGGHSKQPKEDQEEVRKTFVSSLPSKIDSFERKVFLPQCGRRLKVKPQPPSTEQTHGKLRYLSEQKQLRQQLEKRELQRTLAEFRMSKARFEQNRAGLTDHSVNLSRQVRRMPRDNIHRHHLTRLLTARVELQQNSSPLWHHMERINTEVPTSSTGIDGLTLLHNPLELIKKRR